MPPCARFPVRALPQGAHLTATMASDASGRVRLDVAYRTPPRGRQPGLAARRSHLTERWGGGTGGGGGAGAGGVCLQQDYWSAVK